MTVLAPGLLPTNSRRKSENCIFFTKSQKFLKAICKEQTKINFYWNCCFHTYESTQKPNFLWKCHEIVDLAPNTSI